MRRWPTWLVVGALVVLGAVAAADAIRGGGCATVRRTPLGETAAAPAAEPMEGAMSGALFYSDARDDCRLKGLTLPELGTARPPKLRSCRFSLSPDGRAALRGTAEWSPDGRLYAREQGGTIELGSPSSGQTMRFPGRGPAFKPDGTFTYVDDGVVVEWTTDCPPASQLFALPGVDAPARCRRLLLSKADVKALLPGEVTTISGLAWLTDTRLVAVLAAHVPLLGRADVVVVLERGRLIGPTPRLPGAGLRVEASPGGNFFAAWYGNDLYAIRDRNGRAIVFPPFAGVRALGWSPNEHWMVVATERSVYVFRTNEGEARIRRLPIVARDLAWR